MRSTLLNVAAAGAVLAFGVVSVGGIGMAAPAAPSQIGGSSPLNVCFNKGDARKADGGAEMRIYDPAKNSEKCAAGDKRITINQKGPQGPRGPKGDRGDAANKVFGVEFYGDQAAAVTLPAGDIWSATGPVTLTRKDADTWTMTLPAGTFPASSGVGIHSGCPIPQVSVLFGAATLVPRLDQHWCGDFNAPSAGGVYLEFTVASIDGGAPVDFTNDQFYFAITETGPR